MMIENITLRMMNCLQRGVDSLSDEARERIVQFVGSQKVEGSAAFMDRGGKADVYYTLFGWMLAYVFRIPLDAKLRKDYLGKGSMFKSDLVHDAAYRGCVAIDKMMRWGRWLMPLLQLSSRPAINIEQYVEVPLGDVWSPYTQFIWLLLNESEGRKVTNGDEMLQRLESYHSADGGYANTQTATPTLNATAAALAVKGYPSGWNPGEDIRVLQKMQNETGGFSAVASAPVADLLSTATALFVLHCYRVKPLVDATDFIDAHWLSNGGFAATLMDDVGDVEYTFYGLLALGAT